MTARNGDGADTRYHLRTFLQNNGTIIGLVFLLVLATCINHKFLSFENLSNVFRQASANGIIALGVMLTIIIGRIDLSVGSLMALAGFLALYYNQQSLALGLLMPVLIGAVVGCINGFLVIKMRIMAFIATLSMMFCLRGVTLVVTGEKTFGAKVEIPAFDFIGRGTILGFLAVPSAIFIACMLALWFILNRTPLGRSLYATGGNEEASVMMGVRVNRAKWFAFISSGVLTSIAGVVLVSRVGAAYPLSGDGGELDGIAATVIGGTLLTGGRGTVFGTMVGALIIQLMRNIFNMQNTFSSHWEKVITGGLVLIVVLAQAMSSRRSAHMAQKNVRLLKSVSWRRGVVKK